MKLGLITGMVAGVLLATAGRAAAEEIAPGLAEDAVAAVASAELAGLVASLGDEERRRLRGVYVAIDTTLVDVAALPACDDDGDYVVVLSRGLLELVEGVAYAEASDLGAGTRLVAAYGPLLARGQRPGARPLPAPTAAPVAASPASLDQDAADVARDLLAWLVADELAHAVTGALVCPRPTVTRESGDDVWTAAERAEAMARAPSRMPRIAAADAWATTRTLARGRSELPALALLEILAPLEEARAAAPVWTYLALHPRTRARVEAVREAAKGWLDARPPASESSAARPAMR